jgi:two-component system chemotaxis sensor kinase CheA
MTVPPACDVTTKPNAAGCAMDDLLAEFLAETSEALAELDTALVALERQDGDAETLARIFRLVHSVKGAAGFLGLNRLSAVAHAAENLLGLYRDGDAQVTPAGVTAVLSAMDTIRRILAGLAETGREPDGEDGGLIAALDVAGGTTAAAPPPAPPQTPAAQPPATAPAAAAAPPPAEPAPATTQAAEATPASAATAPVQTIRVSVGVLDELMTLASELVLVRNQLLQLSRGEEASPFAAPLARLSRITSDLQDEVMKTRMQPVSAAWGPLPRIVRDLGNELGKRIELAMSGGETELDRQVLEQIRDPLTHMVRNSCDHGLEMPEDRRAAGKPESGRIALSARQEGGRIVIEIADDGRGLDLARVRARALQRGLATEAELAAMRDDDVARFVFRPGFSTAEAITSVSGRGVGMDVVRSNIERIGGTVDLQTQPGRGTTVTIRIPLTLAIVSALVVQAACERFAVPQAGVVELVRVGRGAATVEWLDAAPVLRLRGQLLPLVALAPLLGLRDPYEAGSGVDGFIAVLQGDTGRYGLLVDGVFDTEEIVVKPVAPILRDLAAFSGNTILGDGGVIMILDPAGIARMAGVGAGGSADDAVGAEEESRTQVLLFRAGGMPTPLVVPLGVVARLEALPARTIEVAGGRPMAQYRGQLMPLVALGDWTPPAPDDSQPVMVFQDGTRQLGLLVDEIVDVLEQSLELRPSAERPGFLGSAIVAGRATDVLDCAYWLRKGDPSWFGKHDAVAPRLLLVEDSGFFRQVVVPALTAAGYDVTAKADAAQALRLRSEGRAFDAVLTDIEMPGMDGFGLLEEIRRGGPWRETPVVALTSKAGPADVARGRAAGFHDYVAKFDRDRVLAALARAIGQGEAA